VSFPKFLYCQKTQLGLLGLKGIRATNLTCGNPKQDFIGIVGIRDKLK